MKIGLIGLGRMGSNLALNMANKGHELVVYNRSREKTEELVKENKNFKGVFSLEELKKHLPPPRTVWVMVSSGEAVNETIKELTQILEKGDLIIDGGNSYYKDTIHRAAELEKQGFRFLDVGTSGGIAGARNGACYMVGGRKEDYQKIELLLKDTSVKDGYGYVGPAGSGHFVKMVHNGIEYGMMQSIGEGFELLKQHNPQADFTTIAHIWANGSIIRGYLMDLTFNMFQKDKTLEKQPTIIGQNGEGLWTLKTALELGVAVPTISAAVNKRFESQRSSDFAGKVIQGLRGEFGGHDTKNRL